MAFDATLKGPNSNSYVTVEEADDYFDLEVESTSVSKVKQRFLVSATSRLDMEQYGGKMSANDQRLQFPRTWLVARNYTQNQDFVEYIGGQYYQDPDTVPLQMKIATFELALWYIKEFRNEDPLVSRNDQSRMSQYAIGPLKATLRNVKEDALPDKVVRALRSIGDNGWLGGYPMKLVR